MIFEWSGAITVPGGYTMGYTTKESLAVPIWHKYVLSLKEASAYFDIGLDSLRKLVEDKDADYVFMVGSHAHIKRVAFEKFIDKTSSI